MDIFPVRGGGTIYYKFNNYSKNKLINSKQTGNLVGSFRFQKSKRMSSISEGHGHLQFPVNSCNCH